MAAPEKREFEDTEETFGVRSILSFIRDSGNRNHLIPNLLLSNMCIKKSVN